MKTMYLIYLALFFFSNCNSVQENQLLGMWLIVEENDHYVYDCHEVLSFDENSYKVYDCDIDYSKNPTLLEKGRYVYSDKSLKVTNRISNQSGLNFFLTKQNSINFEIHKVTKDSLIISHVEDNLRKKIKFKRIPKINVTNE